MQLSDCLCNCCLITVSLLQEYKLPGRQLLRRDDTAAVNGTGAAHKHAWTCRLWMHAHELQTPVQMRAAASSWQPSASPPTCRWSSSTPRASSSRVTRSTPPCAPAARCPRGTTAARSRPACAGARPHVRACMLCSGLAVMHSGLPSCIQAIQAATAACMEVCMLSSGLAVLQQCAYSCMQLALAFEHVRHTMPCSAQC